MITSIFYILLAILGIDFLILIHELGHYYMARKLGITVEEFAVGFGKPLVQWERKGVKWKIGMIPFGGYVKMAGMEKKGLLEPHKVEGGFLAQKPWSQIKVAAMGPLVNILFAFVAFGLLWTFGGRNKPFSEFTHHIGWVHDESGPYEAGIRPGDLITQVNHKPFQNFESFLYNAIYEKGALTMSGQEIDWKKGEKTPFTYVFDGGKDLEGVSKAAHALNTLSAAGYLIYDKMPSGAPNKLPSGSPLEQSGITYGDRIVWVDGKLIFSKRQLVETLNEPMVLLTVKRGEKTLLARVPRLSVSDLRLTTNEKGEIDDWRAAAKIKDPVDRLQFIPYNLNSNLEVEGALPYIDDESRAKSQFEVADRSDGEIPLIKGDKILAVQGAPVTSNHDLVHLLQARKVLIVVAKQENSRPIPSKDVEEAFTHSFDLAALTQITETIGSNSPTLRSGNYRLLNPVTPVRLNAFPVSKAQSEEREETLEKRRKQIEEISDPKIREEALRELSLYENRLMLGVTLQDKLVAYNPSPFFLMGDVFGQIVKTFKSLITGSISPKYMAGPIGIVQVIQYGWSKGVKEALYFLGMISLNLGILNLLPIPVLDGGHITFALWEMATKKPLSIKTRERLIFPFIILLVAVFLYFSFNDIVRIITQFF